MPAFATFAALKAAVTSFALRTGDAVFAAQLPTFAAMAEERMYVGGEPPFKSDPIRVAEMETTVDVPITDGTGTLPSGYLSMRRIRWDGEPKTVPDYEAPSVFYANRYTVTSGSPVAYTVEGNSIHVSPMITGTLKATYYARPTALAADGDTNAILTTYPTIYLRAMLVEAYGFIRDAEMQAQEFAAYKAAVDALGSHERRKRMGGNRLAIRIPGARV